jgi:hypothetical protein
VAAVQADGAHIVVRTAAGETLQSSDGGTSFSPVPGNPPVVAAPVVRSGSDAWRIDPTGAVLHAHAGGSFQLDPRSPDLGAGAHLLAAPAAVPGVVVAVARNGSVWRRSQDGGWGLALLLLPAGLIGGVPTVTSVAAFAQPVTGTVYLSTDGYSVLLSADSGDDWIHANPGLPDSVFALAADAPARSLYAATSDGLYVHHLQSLPAPPSYSDSALALRWLGIGLVALASVVIAAVALSRLLAPEPSMPG